MRTRNVQNSIDKNTKKSADAINKEPKIESSESPKLSNEEYKPTGSVESEDLDTRNVEQTRVYVLSETDEAMVVADTCTIVVSVCDQLTNEKHILDNAEIQITLLATLVHEPKMKADDLYYEIFLLPADCEKTCRWFYSSSFSWLLILLHYKTR